MNIALILRRPRFIIAGALVTLSVLFLVRNHYQLRNWFTYGLRPLWDEEKTPKNVIPHYYAEVLSMKDADICGLHGWSKRPLRPQKIKVLDAILMSSELDLLEIRMNELDPVVDKWFIVESNTTFTGLPKQTYFRDNKERFAQFAHKIEYFFIPGGPLAHGEKAFKREGDTRNIMSSNIHAHVHEFPPNTQPMVIMSDVDEIPARSTIQLLKTCDFGDTIHLKLRSYLYSFEWYIGQQSWRASVNIWKPDSFYRHSLAPLEYPGRDNALADAGWHCSFCFRTLEEYRIKMKGYSHSDRLGGKNELLDPQRIQKIICEGTDIFGMLPEAYNYGDLISQLNLRPQFGAVHIPRYVIQQHSKFKFLLPKGCLREDFVDPETRKLGTLSA